MNALPNLSQPVAVNGEPTCAVIAEVVAEFYQVRLADMLSQRRTDKLTHPRKVTYYLCRTLTSKSLPEIGRHLGGRDHTTIRSGAIRIEQQLEASRDLEHEIVAITAVLQGLLARFGVVVNDRFPDRSAPEIARRVLDSHRGEYAVSMAELRVLLNYAATEPDHEPAPPDPAPDLLAGPAGDVVAAFAEFERARFSRDEGRATDHLIQKLKGLREAWSETQGD